MRGLDLPGETLNFWVEHWVLALLPAVWIARRRYHLYGGLAPVTVSWAIFFILHGACGRACEIACVFACVRRGAGDSRACAASGSAAAGRMCDREHIAFPAVLHPPRPFFHCRFTRVSPYPCCSLAAAGAVLLPVSILSGQNIDYMMVRCSRSRCLYVPDFTWLPRCEGWRRLCYRERRRAMAAVKRPGGREWLAPAPHSSVENMCGAHG